MQALSNLPALAGSSWDNQKTKVLYLIDLDFLKQSNFLNWFFLDTFHSLENKYITVARALKIFQEKIEAIQKHFPEQGDIFERMVVALHENPTLKVFYEETAQVYLDKLKEAFKDLPQRPAWVSAQLLPAKAGRLDNACKAD